MNHDCAEVNRSLFSVVLPLVACFHGKAVPGFMHLFFAVLVLVAILASLTCVVATRRIRL